MGRAAKKTHAAMLERVVRYLLVAGWLASLSTNHAVQIADELL